MPKILTEEECERVLRIPYNEYQELIITGKPHAETAADTRKFNERLTHTMIELHHMVVKARSDAAVAEKEFKEAKANTLAKLAEAKIRSKNRNSDEIGNADPDLAGITNVDPAGLTENMMKAIAEREAYKLTAESRKQLRKLTFLSEMWEGQIRIGKRIGDELVAFGIENKMSKQLASDRNV